MRKYLWALMIGPLLLGPLSARADDPSGSIPSPSLSGPVPRHWEGTATETPGIYAGPATAKVILDLNPHGTFTETWKQGDKQWTTSGTWRVQGKRLVLESSDPSRARRSLQRRGDTLYTVAMESLPTGRATTTAIELHPAAS